MSTRRADLRGYVTKSANAYIVPFRCGPTTYGAAPFQAPLRRGFRIPGGHMAAPTQLVTPELARALRNALGRLQLVRKLYPDHVRRPHHLRSMHHTAQP